MIKCYLLQTKVGFIHIWIIVTWKYRIIVHTNPRTMAGLPSTMSVELMLTSLIWVDTKIKPLVSFCHLKYIDSVHMISLTFRCAALFTKMNTISSEPCADPVYCVANAKVMNTDRGSSVGRLKSR